MSHSGPPRGSSARSDDLSDRARRVLALLVREYIDRGEPVSSLWLAGRAAVGVSSATVRNILARLEDEGYVHQPHTSAGRIPTDLGYRSYVDQLLQSRRPARPPAEVEARLRQAGTVESLLSNLSQEVSRASHHLGFVLARANDGIGLKHIEFIALDTTRILVVLVADDGQVWHKAVTLDEKMSVADLTQAANYLNERFAGQRLADIRSAIVDSLHEDRVLYDGLVSRALSLASSTLEDVASGPQLFVYGASSLVEGLAEEIPVTTLRAVLAMLEEKHRLIRLLTEYIEGPGLTVVIGAEHSVPDFRNFSLVASSYTEGTQTAVVGVIGPRRMRYSRAITAVESLVQAAGRVLVTNRN